MPESLSQRAIQAGALLLGALFYVFVLLFDLVAGLVNVFKRRWQLPQLTDFRRHEEQSLHIPFFHETPNHRICLKKSASSSGDVLTYTLPHLENNPNEVLLEVGLDQKLDVSTEIELCLSYPENQALSESVFLFVHPFIDNPALHYPQSRLWVAIPASRALELSLVDIQPNNPSFRFSSVTVSVLQWR